MNETLLTPNAAKSGGTNWIGGSYTLMGHQISLKVETIK